MTTAGHDGPALVGQLALCFVGAVRVDNVAKALGALLGDLSDGNLGWTKARKEPHDATLDGAWSHHRGTVRCTPACAQADVPPVIEGVGHPRGSRVSVFNSALYSNSTKAKIMH